MTVPPARKAGQNVQAVSNPLPESAPTPLGAAAQPIINLQQTATLQAPVAVAAQPAVDRLSSPEVPDVATADLPTAAVPPLAVAKGRPLPSPAGAVAAPTVFPGVGAALSVPKLMTTVDAPVLPTPARYSPSEAASTQTEVPASRRPASPITVASTPAEGPTVLSNLSDLAIAASAATTSGTGGTAVQSVVDHFAFELTMRRQGPSLPTDSPSNDIRSTAAYVSPPSRTLNPRSTVTAMPETVIPSGLDANDRVAVKQNDSDSNATPIILPGASTSSLTNTVLMVPAPSSPTLSGGASKPDLPTISLSEKLPIDTPDKATQPTVGVVHEVNLRVQAESGESVSVRLSDHSGQVQISVRSTDQAAATTLRQDLSSLSAGLERQGWKTDVSGVLPQTGFHDGRDLANVRHSDDQGRQQSQPDWQAPPDKKRPSPGDQWAELNEQETK